MLGAPAPRFLTPRPGAPLPAHERVNRRVVSRRLREELGLVPRCPSFAEGLAASLRPEE